MSAINGFNRVAPVYDALQRMVFGNALIGSQRAFLDAIPDNSNVLILGGGSGETMKDLLNLRGGCHIWYVEASDVMISLAREQVQTHEGLVHFIHGTEASIPRDVVFDAAITGFFLDIFPDERVVTIGRAMSRHLRREGIWLITDFVDTGKWWHRILLWTMYRFFRMTSGIESRSLPHWQTQVAATGFRQNRSRCFSGGFINSSVWTNDVAPPFQDS